MCGQGLLDPRLQAIPRIVEVRAQRESVIVQDGRDRAWGEVEEVVQDDRHTRSRIELCERFQDRHAIHGGSRVSEQGRDLPGLCAAAQDFARGDREELRTCRLRVGREVSAPEGGRQRGCQDALGIGLVLEDEVPK